MNLVVKNMKHFIFLLFISQASYAQYDYNCFESVRTEVKKEMEILMSAPLDSIEITTVDSIKRKVPKARKANLEKVSAEMVKIIGCQIPNFSFFNMQEKEFSIDKINSSYTIVYFTYLHCGDECNDYIRQFSKLKDQLQDSLTVIIIYKEKNSRVAERISYLPENVEYVANAEQIWRNYALSDGLTTALLLDRSKTVLLMEVGANPERMYPIIYDRFLKKIREISCKD